MFSNMWITLDLEPKRLTSDLYGMHRLSVQIMYLDYTLTEQHLHKNQSRHFYASTFKFCRNDNLGPV